MSDDITIHVCPPPGRHDPHPDRPIAVGFGYAAICKDGVAVWSESNDIDEDWMTFADATRMAEAAPDAVWAVIMDAPLWSATWLWNGSAWDLVETGAGFA